MNEHDLLEELRTHASVVIFPADKISAVVIRKSAMDHKNCSPCLLLKKHPATKTTVKTIKPLRIGRTTTLLMMSQDPLSVSAYTVPKFRCNGWTSVFSQSKNIYAGS